MVFFWSFSQPLREFLCMSTKPITTSEVVMGRKMGRVPIFFRNKPSPLLFLEDPFSYIHALILVNLTHGESPYSLSAIISYFLQSKLLLKQYNPITSCHNEKNTHLYPSFEECLLFPSKDKPLQEGFPH